MNILETIPHLASAGAMGVSLVCLFKVYGLLTKEQEQENPRPVFLRSIYVFMGFGLIMTVVALGIEVSRYFMPSNVESLAQLRQSLVDIGDRDFYSLDRNGIPESIELRAFDTIFTLSQAYPEDRFKATPLKITKKLDSFYVAKYNGGKDVTYGYFSEGDLRRKLNEFFPASTPLAAAQPTDAELETFFAAGIAYSPKIAEEANVKLSSSETRAINRLWVFLDSKGKADLDTRENAIKILVQPRLLSRLDTTDYAKLINLIRNGKIREPTEAKFDLAQVYYRRYKKYPKQFPNGMEDYERSSWEYIQGFHEEGWTAANVRQYAFYETAAKAFFAEDILDCDTCLLNKQQLALLSRKYDGSSESR
jgi:hypothetical protein